MKAIFAFSTGGLFAPQGKQLTGKYNKSNVSEGYKPKSNIAFVPLEIKASTLQRLILEQQLVAEELHCNNQKSKDIVQKAMLDTLLR